MILIFYFNFKMWLILNEAITQIDTFYDLVPNLVDLSLSLMIVSVIKMFNF
jgi:hypothetical protein